MEMLLIFLGLVGLAVVAFRGVRWYQRRNKTSALSNLGVTAPEAKYSLPWDRIDTYINALVTFRNKHDEKLPPVEEPAWPQQLPQHEQQVLRALLMRRAIGCLDVAHRAEKDHKPLQRLYSQGFVPEETWQQFERLQQQLQEEMMDLKRQSLAIMETAQAHSFIQEALKIHAKWGMEWPENEQAERKDALKRKELRDNMPWNPANGPDATNVTWKQDHKSIELKFALPKTVCPSDDKTMSTDDFKIEVRPNLVTISLQGKVLFNRPLLHQIKSGAHSSWGLVSSPIGGPGTVVQLQGLKADQFNGRKGIVADGPSSESREEDSEPRFPVRLLGKDGKIITVKTVNLKVISPPVPEVGISLQKEEEGKADWPQLFPSEKDKDDDEETNKKEDKKK